MKITWGAVASQTLTSPVIYGLDIGTQYTFSAYVWVPTGDAPVRLTVADVTTGAQNTLFDQFQRLTVSWTATSTSDRKSVVEGKRVSGRVDLGGLRILKKKKKHDIVTIKIILK